MKQAAFERLCFAYERIWSTRIFQRLVAMDYDNLAGQVQIILDKMYDIQYM